MIHRAVALMAILSLGISSSSANDVKDAILLEHVEAISSCQKALEQIEVQARDEIQRRQVWLSFYESLRGTADKWADELLTDKRTLIQRMSKTATYVKMLARSSDDPVLTPEGSIPPEAVDDKVRELENGLAALERAVNAGDEVIYILGYPRANTRNELERLIAEKREELDRVSKSVRDGNYPIFYPLVGNVRGWINGQELQKKISTHRQAIEKKMQLIAAGDYPVVIPGFSRLVSRNDMARMIQTQADRISDLMRRRNDKTYAIPTFLGANQLNQKQIEDLVESLEKALANGNAALGEGTWRTRFPIFGDISLNSLRERIDKARERIAEIRRQMAAGEFRALIPGLGWVTQKSVDEFIRALSGRTDPGSLTRLAELRDAPPKISQSAQLNSEYVETDHERLERILKLAPFLFEPWRKRKQIEIEERNNIISRDFSLAAETEAAEIKRRIAMLEKLRDTYIPE